MIKDSLSSIQMPAYLEFETLSTGVPFSVKILLFIMEEGEIL